MPDQFRIEYTIQRRRDGGAGFRDIGFGSSGSNGSIDAALYTIQSDIQNRLWETSAGMPDPADVLKED